MKQTQGKKEQTGKYQKNEKIKIPYLFNLELKDLTDPITVRRIRIFQLVFVLSAVTFTGYYVWQNVFRSPTGVELINEMVDAAGGMAAWNNIQSGQFTRTQKVYDMTGKQLSEQKETFYFRKTGDGIKLMVKAIDSEGKEVIISEDDEGFWATKESSPTDPETTSRDLGMMCDSQFCEPNCNMQMAFFRFSMPFKLTDYGVKPKVNNVSTLGLLDWNPLENFDLESEPIILDVSYIPTVGKDKWRFLVNPETKLIHKVEYYNKSDFGTFRPEEIYWTDHKTVDGITFSHKWVKFWSNGKVMNEYIYSDVSFNNQVDKDFFNRPADMEWSLANN
jgi:outer membrane lipoprotein-sorting protein